MTQRRATSSWVDRLLAWVERLPGPAWLAYLAFVLIHALLGNGLRWLDGTQPPVSFDPVRLAEAPIAIYFLALIQYLNESARTAVSTFRPMLEVDDSDIQRLQAEITSLPRRVARIATGVGIVAGIISVLTGPASWGLKASSAIPTVIYTYLFASLIASLAILTFVHTIRQLRLVNRIHEMASKINLWHRQPVYAFSSLTAQTGVGIVLIIYYYIFITYTLDLYGPVAPSALDAIGLVLFLVLAVASFVLPLNGMHRKLTAEKRRLIAETDRRFEQAVGRLHRLVESEDFEQADGLNKTLASLVIERDALSKISTWPWRPETLRSFLSTIAIPIVLFLITSLLGQVLGLR